MLNSVIIIHGRGKKIHGQNGMTILRQKTLEILGSRLVFRLHEHGLLRTGKEWQHPDVISPFNRLYFVLSGTGELESSVVMPLRPGCMYLIPAGVRCTYSCTSRLEKIYFHFNLELFPGCDLCAQEKKIIQCAAAKNLVSALKDLIEHDSFSSAVTVEGLVLQTIARMIPSADSFLKKSLTLHERYESFFSLLGQSSLRLDYAAIAALLGVKQQVLSKQLKRDTGLSLRAHCDRTVLQRAEILLFNPDLRIRQIAAQLGFDDEFYFSCFFVINIFSYYINNFIFAIIKFKSISYFEFSIITKTTFYTHI